MRAMRCVDAITSCRATVWAAPATVTAVAAASPRCLPAPAPEGTAIPSPRGRSTSMPVIVNPCSNPAFAAGLLNATDITCTPSGSAMTRRPVLAIRCAPALVGPSGSSTVLCTSLPSTRRPLDADAQRRVHGGVGDALHERGGRGDSNAALRQVEPEARPQQREGHEQQRDRLVPAALVRNQPCVAGGEHEHRADRG